MAKAKRWTKSENDKLFNQVRVFPQNLSKCFHIVAQETGRTPSAVANHWYTSVSKDPQYLCFFTASSKHVSKNRKNGAGEVSTESIWKKLLKVLGIKSK